MLSDVYAVNVPRGDDIRHHTRAYGPPLRHRILSEPATVWWAGFRSDTLKLQQQGWQIAVEEDIAGGRIRLLLKHGGMNLYALCNEVEFNYRERMHGGYRPPPEFNVVMASSEFRSQTVGHIDFAAFREVDAKPQYVDTEIKSIEDFRIFAAPMVRTEEIIVEPETVQSMLEKIREMQAPEQARLREKNRREESAEPVAQQKFHAQIISLAARRA